MTDATGLGTPARSQQSGDLFGGDSDGDCALQDSGDSATAATAASAAAAATGGGGGGGPARWELERLALTAEKSDPPLGEGVAEEAMSASAASSAASAASAVAAAAAGGGGEGKGGEEPGEEEEEEEEEGRMRMPSAAVAAGGAATGPAAAAAAEPRKTLPAAAVTSIPFAGAEITSGTDPEGKKNGWGFLLGRPPKPYDGTGIVHWVGTDGGRAAWTNPAEAGRMTVTRSSDGDYGGKASNAVGDRGIDCSTYDNRRRGEYYLFDFMQNEVAPVWYGLRHGQHDSSFSLRHWRLEASHTGRSDGEWVVLRVHDGDESLNGGYASASWELDAPRPQQSQQQQQQQQQQPEFFRFFRVIMTGKCSSGYDRLFLSGFELWGWVRRNEAWRQ